MAKEYVDGKGGKVTLEDGVRQGLTEFSDETTKFYVGKRWRGIKGADTKIIAGSPQQQPLFGSDTANLGIFWCTDRWASGRYWPANDGVFVTDAVMESVVRERIASFVAKHPDIGKQLREAKVPLTIMNGKPATLAELEQYPSHFRACPLDKKDKIIERIQ